MIQQHFYIKNELVTKFPKELSKVKLKDINKSSFTSTKIKKIITNQNQLLDVINNYSNDCSLVTVKGENKQHLSELYFDTPELKMYFEHHNKTARRSKLLKRHELNSNKIYLEAINTDNKHKTSKKKKQISDFEPLLLEKHHNFVNKNLLYPAFQLKPVLNLSYERYLFIDKSQNILIKIDTAFRFWNDYKINFLPDLVVASIKTKETVDKELIEELKQRKTKHFKFNKYEIGMALTNPDLKQNLLKQKIYNINKICNA